MQEFHASPTGGHAGVAKTLNRLKAKVYWGTCAKMLKHFISTYITCQQMNCYQTSIWSSSTHTTFVIDLGGYSVGFHHQLTCTPRSNTHFGGHRSFFQSGRILGVYLPNLQRARQLTFFLKWFANYTATRRAYLG